MTIGNQPWNTVKIEVVQAGPRPGSGHLPAIALERMNSTGVKHVDGAISMAREGVCGVRAGGGGDGCRAEYSADAGGGAEVETRGADCES